MLVFFVELLFLVRFVSILVFFIFCMRILLGLVIIDDSGFSLVILLVIYCMYDCINCYEIINKLLLYNYC